MRRWVLELPGRPPTANAQRRGGGDHWSKRAASTRKWRDTASILQRVAAGSGAAPRTADRIMVTCQQCSKDRRWLQDLGACQPATKAAIDGLCDAGLIPDDTSAHLVELRFVPPDVCGFDALRLIIETVD